MGNKNNRAKMISLFIIFFFLTSPFLYSCGGGGGGGSSTRTPPPPPKISSLSTNSALPTALLISTGTGFDPTATLSVSFFDNNGFKLDIPVLVADSTSITVSVPPYISPSTGMFGPGTVNVQVIQNAGGNIVTSNTIQNFQLQDLPTPTAPPGAVTLNTLDGIIDYYVQLQGAIKGTLLDIPELDTAIANNITNLQALITHIQAIMKDPSTTFTLGTINGNNVLIGTQALLETDRMIIGMFETLSVTSLSASMSMNSSLAGVKIFQQAAIPCQQEATAQTDFLLHGVGDQVTDTSGYRGYLGCESGGLPGAVQTTNKVIGGAGTIGVAGLALAGAPEIALALPSAALFYATVMSMVTQIDVATALRNSNDAASYKAIHQAVDQIEEMLRDSLVGKVIGKTAGNIKDIYSGLADLMHAYKNTATLVPTTTTTKPTTTTSTTTTTPTTTTTSSTTTTITTTTSTTTILQCDIMHCYNSCYNAYLNCYAACPSDPKLALQCMHVCDQIYYACPTCTDPHTCACSNIVGGLCPQ
jgi:hypothetical protein